MTVAGRMGAFMRFARAHKAGAEISEEVAALLGRVIATQAALEEAEARLARLRELAEQNDPNDSLERARILLTPLEGRVAALSQLAQESTANTRLIQEKAALAQQYMRQVQATLAALRSIPSLTQTDRCLRELSAAMRQSARRTGRME